MNCDFDSTRPSDQQALLARVRNFLATWRDGVEQDLRHESRPEIDEFPLLRPRCCRNHGRELLP